MNIVDETYQRLSTDARRKVKLALGQRGVIENTFHYDRRREWHGTIPHVRVLIYAKVLNIPSKEFQKAPSDRLDTIAERLGLMLPT